MDILKDGNTASMFTLYSNSLFKFQPNQKISLDINDVNADLIASTLQKSMPNSQAGDLTYSCSFHVAVRPLGLASFKAGKYPLSAKIPLSGSDPSASAPQAPAGTPPPQSPSPPGTPPPQLLQGTPPPQLPPGPPAETVQPMSTSKNIISQLLTAFIHQSTVSDNTAEVPYSFSTTAIQKYLPQSLGAVVLNVPKTCDTI